MPCTLDVLKKHLQRVFYQSAIWRRSLCSDISAPPMHGHGWIVKENDISIDWMDLPPAPDGVHENVNCGCNTGCYTNRCSCMRAELPHVLIFVDVIIARMVNAKNSMMKRKKLMKIQNRKILMMKHFDIFCVLFQSLCDREYILKRTF